MNVQVTPRTRCIPFRSRSKATNNPGHHRHLHSVLHLIWSDAKQLRTYAVVPTGVAEAMFSFGT